MTADDRWLEMRQLFEQLVDLPAPERQAALLDLHANDPALARQVESLILTESEAASALDGVVEEAIESAAEATRFKSESADNASTSQFAPGDEIGPYRLEEELGRGGMGVVFRAARADAEYRSSVAIKVLRGGSDSGELLSRFRTERQILADLDHVAIARLLDGGSTASGQPYLVMEYVDGLPITEFCDQQRLDLRARLELFLEICAAVRFAHRNLVVHRDLKPANILVTHDGAPKLLDFGIAKLLEPGRAEHTVAETQVGARLMTPDYASPEQVLGQPVTTSSDVYALGILLYELLTGVLPFSGESLPDAMRRVLAETTPETPSRALRGIETVEQIAAARKFEVEPLRKVLEGDLDHIALMALRTEPERRYASVGHLMDDVQRHLDGLPVAARPATLSYRATKFVTRNRGAVAMGTALALLLVSLVAFYTVRLQQEKTEAQVEAAKAKKTAEFLQELFEVSDPSRSKGETVTARELLDQGAARIERLEGQPDVQASMMDIIGNVYRTLALYDEAEPLLERALALREQLSGDAHRAETAVALQSLGNLRQAQGDAATAEALQRRALSIWATLDADDSLEMANSYSDLGSALFDGGDYAAAEQAQRQALEIHNHIDQAVTSDANSRSARATALDQLAAALHEQGLYEKAELHYREALALKEELFGLDSLQVADSHSNLGNLLRLIDRVDESEAAHRTALAVRRKVLGPDHPNLTTSINSLAVLLSSQNRVEEALPLFEDALRIRIESLGPDHPRVGVPLTGLANALRQLGRFDEAEARYRESVDLHRASLPEDHPFIAHPIAGLASTLSSGGDHRASADLYREALRIRQTSLEPTHWQIAYTEGLLGAQLVKLGQLSEGLRMLRDASTQLAELLGPDNSRSSATQSRLDAAIADIGQERANQVFRRP